MEASISAIEATIEELIGLGVEWVSACHYSGDNAQRLFQEHFGQNYIHGGDDSFQRAFIIRSYISSVVSIPDGKPRSLKA